MLKWNAVRWSLTGGRQRCGEGRASVCVHVGGAVATTDMEYKRGGGDSETLSHSYFYATMLKIQDTQLCVVVRTLSALPSQFSAQLSQWGTLLTDHFPGLAHDLRNQLPQGHREVGFVSLSLEDSDSKRETGTRQGTGVEARGHSSHLGVREHLLPDSKGGP